VPRLDWAANSTYVKVRDRQSYEFALCSCAVALDVRDGRIVDARVAPVGLRRCVAVDRGRGRATWRTGDGEVLRGSCFAATTGAHPLSGNEFKTTLLKRPSYEHWWS